MTNVISLHKKAPEPYRVLAINSREDEAMPLSIPPDLARSIRLTAGMMGKDPQEFLLDWLKSGFPEIAA